MKKIIVILYSLLLALAAVSAIDKNQGIILADNAIVFEKPDLKSKHVAVLPKNALIVIKSFKKNSGEENDCFFEIADNTKTLGWIQKNYIGVNIYSDVYKIKFNMDEYVRNSALYNSNNKNAELWIIEQVDDFGIQRFMYVLSTKTDNQVLFSFDTYSKLKLFENIDINGDGNREIVAELPFYASPDSTNGSVVYIYSIIDEMIYNIFKEYTSYFSHVFEIYFNRLEISKGDILITNIYLSDTVNNNKDKPGFKAFYTNSIFKKYKLYRWDVLSRKYTLVSTKEKQDITSLCKVDGLRMRESPSLNAKVIRSLKAGEIFTVLEMKDGYVGNMQEIQPGVYGFWIKIVGSDGTTGWAFSYYLDFGYDFLNIYMSSKNIISFPMVKLLQ